MNIIGIGGSNHDFGAVLIQENKVQIAIEDERLTRVKYGYGSPYALPLQPSIEYCLQASNININDIDIFCGNSHLERRALDQPLPNLHQISHHVAHAASSFYTSDFDEAAILVMDGAGSSTDETTSTKLDLESTSIGFANQKGIDIKIRHTGQRHIATCFWKYMAANSIGSIYQMVTEAIGFTGFDNGKTMGLAAYGSDLLVSEMEEFISINDDGRINFDPYSGFLDWIMDIQECSRNPFQTKANIAFAAQSIFEKALLTVARHTQKVTGAKVLCYAGGCALNSVANFKLIQSGIFSHIHMFPASGDNGTAMGSALYAHHEIAGLPRIQMLNPNLSSIAYLGKLYSVEEIESALWDSPCYFRHVKNIAIEVAQRLSAGQVVGWFQGRSEIGPRALGNRSILANASNTKMRDHINLHIKGRETFRPLAPAIKIETVSKYFKTSLTSPFMLVVAPFKEKYRTQFSAAAHIDGTARLQTVSKSENKLFYTLIDEFEKITGEGIVLNTSFNSAGKPIVESPKDAIAAFQEMKLDALAIGNYIVEKHTPWSERL